MKWTQSGGFTCNPPHKASGSDNGAKIKVIRANANKYPIIKMCKVLNISRSTYYSYKEPDSKEHVFTETVVKIFNENQHVYGTRKLKVELSKLNHKVWRHRIAAFCG